MHIIRLRGPWQVEAVARFVPQVDGTYLPVEENLPPAARATMPADWSRVLGADFLGRVRYRRTFHRPTGLESGKRVFLVVEPARSNACVTLKRDLVGFVSPGEAAGRFEITDRLEEDNRLEVIVDHPELDEMRRTVGDPALHPPGGLVGEVRLEIEERD
jgi:hypothetical protein